MANKRLIDANAVCMLAEEWLRCNFFNDIEYDAVICAVEDAPTVDAVEVVHAYWEGDEPGEWRCSHCKEPAADAGYEQSRYCGSCGAIMDGEAP